MASVPASLQLTQHPENSVRIPHYAFLSLAEENVNFLPKLKSLYLQVFLL